MEGVCADVTGEEAGVSETGADGGPDARVTDSREFTPEADTYIAENDKPTNFGGAPDFQVGDGFAMYGRKAYLRFNVLGLSAGAKVTDATLTILCMDPATVTGGSIFTFLPTMDAWAENEPTWLKPLEGGKLDGNPLDTLRPVQIGTTYSFTNLASAISGNGRVTFIIESPNVDGAAYSSKEGAAPPRLRVTYVR